MKPLFLDENDVLENLPFEQLFTGIEQGFVNYTTKKVNQPGRMIISVGVKNSFLVKPVVSEPNKGIATKLLTLYPDNESQHGLPSHQAVVTLFDLETGSLQGVLDGAAITDIRTAVATAVAVKHLSKKEAKVLAVIGTGHQGKSHINALRELNQFDKIRVYSRTKEKREKFAEDMNVIACNSVEEATKNADVIVTATLSEVPYLSVKYVKKGALINIVGAAFPNMREVHDELMHSSQIFTDSIEESYKSCGDIIASKATIDGELGSVIEGKLEVDWNRTRIFKSNGLGVQDLIAAKIVIETFRTKH